MPEKKFAIPIEYRPFVAVVGSLPAVNEVITLDVEQYRHIDPATLPSGISVTVTDGAWQPITLTRQENRLDAQIQLDLKKTSHGRQRKTFIRALSNAAGSLAYEGKIADATVVAKEKDRQAVIRWSVPFDPAVTSEDALAEVRFRWDVLYSRAEKMLGC